MREDTRSNSEYFLDITSEICPMTFVKTKLLIEKAPEGARVEVRLKGAEPLSNVPRSVREHGHHIISLVPEEADGGAGVHRLIIEKSSN